MGIGRLNPGCNDCGCVPVVECPPCDDCQCYGDNDCNPIAKRMQVKLQFSTYSIFNSLYVPEFYGLETTSTLECGDGELLIPNSYYTGLPGSTEPQFFTIAYSLSNESFFIRPRPEGGPFNYTYSPARFEYESTCLCSEYVSSTLTQITFPNAPWALAYPWLDENGWLLNISPQFLVLKSVEKVV